MTRRKRASRRLIIDIDRLLAAYRDLADIDASWLGRGYERTNARLWRRRDGTYTARLVWRNRAAPVSAVTCTVQGITLP